jgi:hypothetical protein
LDRIICRWPKIGQKRLHYCRIALYLVFSLIGVFAFLATQSRLAKLTQAIEVPSLTANDDKVFLGVLQKEAPGKVSIYWANGNPDAEAFAIQLHARLLDARWESQLMFGSDTTFTTPRGLGIFVKSLDTAPPYAKTLQTALEAVGYQTPIEVGSNVQSEDTPALLVGAKVYKSKP